MKLTPFLLTPCTLLLAGYAMTAPVSYEIDGDHTHPSIETDHFAGVSVWRGLFSGAKGKITLDREAGTGTVDVTIDTTTAEFANKKLNEHVIGPEVLDTAKFPTAEFKGTLQGFQEGKPTQAVGNFTLHGVTKPLTLHIDSFKCFQNPMIKKEVCGADASGTFDRSDFGVNYAQNYGFAQKVTLHIQIEADKIG